MTAADIERLASALKAANFHPQSAAEQQQARDNLKVQQDMAAAARRMFWVGLSEAVITFFGVVLVGLTLYHTREAAKAARDSVREAKRAADAAQAQSAAADRPHVTVSKLFIAPFDADPDAGHDQIKIGFNFHNYGEDLAFLDGHVIGYDCWSDWNIPDPEVTELKKMYWPISPGEGWGINFDKSTATINLDADKRAKVLSGDLMLFFFGCIHYRDTSGAPHEHRFLYQYRLIDSEIVPYPDDRYWKYT